MLRRESAITRRQKAALEEKSWAKPVVQPVLKELRKKQLAWERANPSKVPPKPAGGNTREKSATEGR